MKVYPVLTIIGLTLATNAMGATVEVATADQLKAELAKAPAGTTIQLAPGTYTLSPVIPAGVTLRGAGYRKTILDTGTAAVGVSLGGDGSALAELAVRTKGATAIQARAVKAVHLSRVLVRGGGVGIRMLAVAGARVENCIVEGNQTGLALDGVRECAIVNNTLTRTDSVAISLAKTSASAIFNNLVAHAGVAIVVNQPGSGLRVDHNLYLALSTGKFEDSVARISLGPWRDVSGGLDAESVSLPVTFRDAAHEDYQPVSTLDWNPGMLTSAGWGVPRLGDFSAPSQDIVGDQRPAAPGVGAREGVAKPVKDVDGTFTVENSEGTKSAGVFMHDGQLVRYLFHDLPLAKGKYGFVLPSRTEQGAELKPGDYELRLVASNLRWKYRMLTANNGAGTRVNESDRDGVWRVAFGADHSLILGCGWSERAEAIRARDVKTGKPIWSLPGTAGTLGLCRGGDGLMYVLQVANPSNVLIRLDDKGHLKPWPGGELKLPVKVPQGNGLAELDGMLYITSKDGQVFRLAIKSGKLEPAFKTAEPFHPVADRKRNLLWMISGGKGFAGGTVTAFTPTGEVKYTVKKVANPLGIAVEGDRLAVADYDLGKVQFFEIRNPAEPAAEPTIGRGDGPYGPVAADRFWFQKGQYTQPHEVCMELDDTGRLALLDGGSRPMVFDAAGKELYMGNAQFGNAPFWARFPGEESRFFDPASRVSWIIDATRGAWRPEAYWGRPELNQGGNSTVGFFKHKEHIYGVMRYTTPDTKRGGLLFLRYENFVGKIVAFYGPGDGGLVVIRDENGDGAITAADGKGTPILDAAGKQVQPGEAVARFLACEPSGNIRSQTSKKWIFKGVDSKGYPLYEFPGGPVVDFSKTHLVSPYDFKSLVNLGGQSESTIAANGDVLLTLQSVAGSPHGMGLSNSGAIDLVRFRRDGKLRWYLPLNDYGPIQGVKQVTPGFILTSWGHQAEWIALDDDGLSLGHLGFPQEAHWTGYWVDHPDHYTLFKGNDGRLHVLVGDYFLNGDHWLSLEHYDDYRKSVVPFTLTPDRAKALAGRPARTAFQQARSEKPRVTVKKLDKPLPIDGDLEKWRKLGLTPQIIMTPATATSNITSARDCSAVIRIAYEGKNLYVQVLRFDDVVCFHQTIASGTNLQDTVEMMINGFHPDGFQFSVGKFSTDGDQVVRRRFFAANLQKTFPADVAPRVVKVLDTAEAVEERKLIEAATGEDLSTAKVIVTEFKLPIDERTWAGSEKTLFPMESGKGFWLGFMMCDNDVPGTDLQKYEVWPASFSTFSPKEDGAWVVLE